MNESRPKHHGRRMERHGSVKREMANGTVVEVQRWRCGVCGATERQYPEGVGRGRLTAAEVARAVAISGEIDPDKLRPLSVAAITSRLRDEGVVVAPATVWRALRGAGVESTWGKHPEGESDG